MGLARAKCGQQRPSWAMEQQVVSAARNGHKWGQQRSSWTSKYRREKQVLSGASDGQLGDKGLVRRIPWWKYSNDTLDKL
jgi:sensor domain CHASE-containing protein